MVGVIPFIPWFYFIYLGISTISCWFSIIYFHCIFLKSERSLHYSKVLPISYDNFFMLVYLYVYAWMNEGEPMPLHRHDAVTTLSWRQYIFGDSNCRNCRIYCRDSYYFTKKHHNFGQKQLNSTIFVYLHLNFTRVMKFFLYFWQ